MTTTIRETIAIRRRDVINHIWYIFAPKCAQNLKVSNEYNYKNHGNMLASIRGFNYIILAYAFLAGK